MLTKGIALCVVSILSLNICRKVIDQAPPEDVGGIGGFLNFREIMLNPSHPEYMEMKEWAKY